ncbi:unnamed protein product [Sphagnum balticum]
MQYVRACVLETDDEKGRWPLKVMARTRRQRQSIASVSPPFTVDVQMALSDQHMVVDSYRVCEVGQHLHVLGSHASLLPGYDHKRYVQLRSCSTPRVECPARIHMLFPEPVQGKMCQEIGHAGIWTRVLAACTHSQCCLQIVRRADVHAHNTSRHGEHMCTGLEATTFVRCPNWQRTPDPCMFVYARYVPYIGEQQCTIGYNAVLNAVTVRTIGECVACSAADTMSVRVRR